MNASYRKQITYTGAVNSAKLFVKKYKFSVGVLLTCV